MLRTLVATLLLLICGSLNAAEVSVFAAASLTDALQEIGRAWEARSGNRILFNFAASSTLARQIEEGAPADLFASADELHMNQLEQKHLIDARSRVSLLSNTLVIVVRADDHARRKLSPADLATNTVASLALAEPSTVPAGIYARAWLTSRGLWPKVAPKVIPTASVRAALAAVESGNVDTAIVYRTDVLSSVRARVTFEVSGPGAPVISYPFALVAGDHASSPQAVSFLAWLRSPEASRVFRKYAFRTR